MWWRRSCYGLLSVGVLIFYMYHGMWLSGILLLAVLIFPWLSLLLSAPAMLLTKAELVCPSQVSMYSRVQVTLRTSCPLPTPMIHWNFLAQESFSGSKMIFTGESEFLADHCGSIQITLRKSFIYDYLGLFRFPIGRKQQQTVLIIPEPLPVENVPGLKKYMAGAWTPKPGGGFAENYDLREYHPGDDLRQIHWKLAAKTGKTILREPIVPVRGKLLLSMTLLGTAMELDRKFGRLFYLVDYFLSMGLDFELYVKSGKELRIFPIGSEQDFSAAIPILLQLPLASEEGFRLPESALQYHIGGEEHEN